MSDSAALRATLARKLKRVLLQKLRFTASVGRRGDYSYSLPIAGECCVNVRLLSTSLNSKEKLRCVQIYCRCQLHDELTSRWEIKKKMQYSRGGGRSRCGHHPAMNPNEVQLLTPTPGSLLSNPHLPPFPIHLSPPPPPAHLFLSPPTPSLSGSLSGLFLLDVAFSLIPPVNLFLPHLHLCSSRLLPFVFKLSLSSLSSSVFLYAGLKKNK